MYSAFNRYFSSSFRYFSYRVVNNELFIKKYSEILLKAALIYTPYNFLNRSKVHCINSYVPSKKQQAQKYKLQIQLSKDQIQWIQWFQKFFSKASRIFQLLCIFLPAILTLPLRYFKTTERLWVSAFVSAVEKAGVVWIKVFQYMSHRRDIIGPQLAQAFSFLRQQAPTHSFEETKRIFKQSYNKQIHQIFQDFDKVPIASGSVSQVYKGKLHGRKVAIKVRHPGVDVHISRDIQILFGISRIGSLFSKSLQIPIGQESLKKTLVDQIDFNVQKDNLRAFNKMFQKDKYVRFPRVFQANTKQSILVENFVEGLPITHFIENPHALNQVMARIGSKAFFEMLMKNNFIHADCHGGNLLVELKKSDSTFLNQVKQYLLQKSEKIQQIITQRAISHEQLRKIYRDSKNDQERMRKAIRKCNQSMQLKIIDAGMVLSLSKQDKQNFVDFIKCIIQSQGNMCAQKIYNLSNYNGKRIKKGQFKKYYVELTKCFDQLNSSNIDNLDGMQLLHGMLDVIRQNNMKLQGEFATLLTNITVMEGIARDLDPNINILKCAIPYFETGDHQLAKKCEKSFLTAL